MTGTRFSAKKRSKRLKGGKGVGSVIWAINVRISVHPNYGQTSTEKRLLLCAFGTVGAHVDCPKYGRMTGRWSVIRAINVRISVFPNYGRKTAFAAYFWYCWGTRLLPELRPNIARMTVDPNYAQTSTEKRLWQPNTGLLTGEYGSNTARKLPEIWIFLRYLNYDAGECCHCFHNTLENYTTVT